MFDTLSYKWDHFQWSVADSGRKSGFSSRNILWIFVGLTKKNNGFHRTLITWTVVPERSYSSIVAAISATNQKVNGFRYTTMVSLAVCTNSLRNLILPKQFQNIFFSDLTRYSKHRKTPSNCKFVYIFKKFENTSENLFKHF